MIRGLLEDRLMGIDTTPQTAAGGPDRDSGDLARLRHARDRELGFPVGRYLQPPPMLFTRDGHNVFLGDLFRGRPAILVCAGPSLTSHDLTLLDRRGVLTMAVNNAATVVRPRMWCSVDDPGNFADAIWQDAGILKFVPLCHMEKPFTVRDERGELVAAAERVGDMPAVFGFRRNEAFVADQWLYEDTFNWGNHGNRTDAYGYKGGRSVMYVALRLLFYLGVRRVYLIGCDFRMEFGKQNYAFEQDRSASSVRGNNSAYDVFNARMFYLKPHFEQAGFQVFNCTPNSGLTVFPSASYEEAIGSADTLVPARIVTAGMYDRQAREAQQRVGDCRNGQRDEALFEPPPRRRGETTDDLPEITLVVPLRPGFATAFTHAWRSWVHFKPWIRRLPLLIMHSPDDPLVGGVSDYIAEHASLTFLPLDATSRGSPSQHWELAKLTVARCIHTPWYWILDPGAIATAPIDWLQPEVFAQSGQCAPVFCGSAWSYTKPADAFERLNAWAEGVQPLASTARVELTFDSTADRVRHPTISPWSFLANSEWIREIVADLGGELPCTSSVTYAQFWAMRRAEAYMRIRMKDYGWDHSFSWSADQVSARSLEVMASEMA